MFFLNQEINPATTSNLESKSKPRLNIKDIKEQTQIQLWTYKYAIILNLSDIGALICMTRWFHIEDSLNSDLRVSMVDQEEEELRIALRMSMPHSPFEPKWSKPMDTPAGAPVVSP